MLTLGQESPYERMDSLAGILSAETGHDSSEIRFICSPLRVCPLGAHVDHQLGVVTGMPIDRESLLAFVPGRNGEVKLRSLQFPGEVSFDLDGIPPRKKGDWGDYARGAAAVLRERYGITTGIDGIVSGRMPIGGLSSSASVGVAYLLALEFVNGLELSKQENIRLDQVIENGYLGLENGILDQSVILLGEVGKLLVLDCASETHDLAAPGKMPDFDIVVAYSGLSISLTGTGYNRRVSECRESARRLLRAAGKDAGRDARLRDVSPVEFEAHGGCLTTTLGRRAKHFFTEQERVRRGVDAWKAGNLAGLGRLMCESGRSSIDNYECGSKHLITLYDILNSVDGVYGARFSGAGFRGSCVGVSDPEARSAIQEAVENGYPEAHPDIKDEFAVDFCRTDSGARIL
ncbi:galactokinase family protein [Thermodesulfobacteriota bacterium]